MGFVWILVFSIADIIRNFMLFLWIKTVDDYNDDRLQLIVISFLINVVFLDRNKLQDQIDWWTGD